MGISLAGAASCPKRGNRYNEPIISLAPPASYFFTFFMPYFMSYLYSRTIRLSLRLSLVVAASAGLMACGSFDGASNRIANVVTPYKMDIVQGNFVSKEQAAALKPGMSRTQVRELLGTPLLVSMFHADRWDYVFTFKRQGIAPQSRKVTVHFKGDVLERFEAGELPTEAEFVASLDSGRQSRKVPVLEASEESLVKFAPAKAAESAVSVAKPLPPLPDKYPPLEPASR
jgi:outer membrane protein assembly factor BamE